MGGGSSYLAILRITGFFAAIWIVGKAARLIGISTIVPEIAVGLALSPSVIGLMPKPYAECQHKDDFQCWDDVVMGAILSGDHEHKLNHLLHHHDLCEDERAAWESFGYGSHGHGGSHEAVQNPCLVVTHDDGHNASHDASHDDHASHDAGHADHASQDAGHHRRLTHGHADDSHSDDGHSSGHDDGHEDGSGHGHDEENYTDGHNGHEDGHNVTHGGHNDEELAAACEAFTKLWECAKDECEAEIDHLCILEPNVFTMVGHAGVSLMIFESGMHFDFEKAREVGPKACAVAVLGTLLPIGAGMGMTMAMGEDVYPDGLAVGVALAPTSVGIALKLLVEAKQLQKDFGQAIITAAFVDDILSLIAFNVLFAVTSGEFSILDVVIKPIIGIVFMCIGAIFGMKGVPPLVEWVVAKLPAKSMAEGQKGMKRADEALFLMMWAFLIAYASFTWWLGTHLWGCFVAGMSFAVVHHAHHVWSNQLKRITAWMLRIFFACTVAFAIPFEELISFEAFIWGMLLSAVACILTKVVCAFFMGETRFVIGWAMVGRAEFAYLIAEMAKSSGIMNERVFAIVIWALLGATIVAPFAFKLLLARYSKVLEEREKLAGDGHDKSSASVSAPLQSTASQKDMDKLLEGSQALLSKGHATCGGHMWIPSVLTGLRFQVIYPKTAAACNADDLREIMNVLAKYSLIATAVEMKCDTEHHFTMYSVQPTDGKPLEAQSLQFLQRELRDQFRSQGAHLVFLPPSFSLQSSCKLATISVFANLQEFPLFGDGAHATKVICDIVKGITTYEFCIMRAAIEMHGTTCLIQVLVSRAGSLAPHATRAGQSKLEVGLECLREGVTDLPDIHPDELQTVKQAIELALHSKVVAIVDPLTHAQGPLGETSHDARTLLAGQGVPQDTTEILSAFEIRFFCNTMVYDILLKALQVVQRHGLGVLAARLDERSDCKVNLVITARDMYFPPAKQERVLDDLKEMCVKLETAGHIDFADISAPDDMMVRYFGNEKAVESFRQAEYAMHAAMQPAPAAPEKHYSEAVEVRSHVQDRSVSESNPLVSSEAQGQSNLLVSSEVQGQIIGNIMTGEIQQPAVLALQPAPVVPNKTVRCFNPIIPCRGSRPGQEGGARNSTPGCRPCGPSSSAWRTQGPGY